MKIVFFNRFFAPDASATSRFASDLAFHLAATGREVHAVASFARGRAAETESLRGVTVHRIAPSGAADGLWARASDYVAYARAARRAAARLLGRGDVAVIKTDPPLLLAVLAGTVARHDAKLVAWLQDLFPEVASAYGVPGSGGLAGAVLRRARDRSLAAADAVVAVSDDMARRVADRRCVREGRLHVIHNWADGQAIAPIPADANPLRRLSGLGDRLVVGYSGNLGRVHDFDTLLGAAALLRDDPGIAFQIVGRGPRQAEVERRIAAEALANVRLEPYRERSALGAGLALPDVHVVSLRPAFEGLVQPSKLYGVLAAGRPCLYVGSAEGETARILRECGAGTTIPPGDAARLAREIRALRDDPPLRARQGASARRAFESRYDAPLALSRWQALIDAL
ncbi:MAG TPA: glycosyltransferase family 4 protein [Usitatibacter sp.]|nr:glycosyltransferase family 4 protein [Usitatibacter sp.]